MDKLVDVVVGEDLKKRILGDVASAFGDWKERDAALEEALALRTASVQALGGLLWRSETVAPLALHLARTGLVENGGIAHHRLRAFPILPGTGLKGMTRRYALARGVDSAALDRVLGREPTSGRRERNPRLALAGGITFLDAFPGAWPRVEVDVLANHHTEYYRGNGEPGDWEEPVPAYFLSLAPGAEMDFALVPSGRSEPGDLQLAKEWLESALHDLGAGAKTAVGYGRFDSNGTQPDAVHEMRLSSPAFFSGANQNEADCRLRGASLKGQVRWWWRALNLGSMDVNTLRRIESALFGGVHGDEPEASAVDFFLREVDAPCLAKAELKSRGFLEAREVPLAPHGQIQGLAYLGYGMSEQGRQRHVAEGGRWELELRVRPAVVGGRKLPAEVVLSQAEAALALLHCFGGIGARSRKGFGSLSISKVLTMEEAQQSVAALLGALELEPYRPRVNALAFAKAKVFRFEAKAPTVWAALERVGLALSAVASTYKHEERKRILGLPRKIHGPKDWPSPGQRGHQKPQRLRGQAPALKRHSSPIVHHLAQKPDSQKCVLSVVVFEAPLLLEDTKGSVEVLTDYIKQLEEQKWRRLG